MKRQGADRALALVVALIFIATALGPREGAAVYLLPISNAGLMNVIGWAVEHDARLLGGGPFGGMILDHAPPGIFSAALGRGAFAIAVPFRACTINEAGTD